jgi:hypothetical protein
VPRQQLQQLLQLTLPSSVYANLLFAAAAAALPRYTSQCRQQLLLLLQHVLPAVLLHNCKCHLEVLLLLLQLCTEFGQTWQQWQAQGAQAAAITPCMDCYMHMATLASLRMKARQTSI